MTGGILNLNKPRGMTSFAVVSLVRRLTGMRRVGHAGTLDPIADGVLPVCLGYATRLVEYLVDQPKAYRAAVRLGVATDTYDSEGTVTATADAGGVTRQELEAALAHFVGEIDQLPPAYSALKFQGRPLYRYARAGKPAPRRARTVVIRRLELLRFDPPVAEVELEVGRGAYVRTLAHDLGERLGCHAHLERLTRMRAGPFSLEDATGLNALQEAAARGVWEDLLYAGDRVLESWHAAIVGQRHSAAICQGRPVELTPARTEASGIAPETPCRAYSLAGDFLAILRYQGADLWHPEKVLAAL